jgi:hypothetical protein
MRGGKCRPASFLRPCAGYAFFAAAYAFSRLDRGSALRLIAAVQGIPPAHS